MAEEYQTQQGNEELWKTLFAEGDPKLQKMQRGKRPTTKQSSLSIMYGAF